MGMCSLRTECWSLMRRAARWSSHPAHVIVTSFFLSDRTTARPGFDPLSSFQDVCVCVCVSISVRRAGACTRYNINVRSLGHRVRWAVALGGVNVGDGATSPEQHHPFVSPSALSSYPLPRAPRALETSSRRREPTKRPPSTQPSLESDRLSVLQFFPPSRTLWAV